MKRFQLYILCLCVILSSAELLGPEARKKTEKDEEEEPAESTDSKYDRVSAEYFKELKDAMNREIVNLQEYTEALRSSKDVPKEEEINKGKVTIGFFYLSINLLSAACFLNCSYLYKINYLSVAFNG